MNQWIKRAAFILSALLILTGTALYMGRNSLLRHLADSKINQAGQQYGLTIHYQSLKLSGPTQVKLTELSVVPNERDTLITLHSLEVNLNLFSLSRGRIEIHKIITNGLSIHFTKKDSIANYDFLFRKNNPTASSDFPETKLRCNFSQQVKESLNLIFGLLPENGEIHNLFISQQRDSTLTTFRIPQLIVKDNHFQTDIIVIDNGAENTWQTKGTLHPDNHQIEAGIYTMPGTSCITIPYIKRYYDATVAFDSLSFSLSEKNINRGNTSLSGNAAISGLHVHHPGLSPDTIDLNRGKLSYQIQVGENFIELDSTSIILFNQLDFHPYIKVERHPKWHIKASINQSSFPSEQLFRSLPYGLFQHVKGIRTQGNLTYRVLLDMDFNRLDSLKFYSIMRGQNFRITDYGNSDLTRMNEEFTYTAYENGQPVRTFAIGPSNPDFRPLDSISPLLQNAILQSEDGGFFYHNGFLPGAIEEALIHDLKVKRFARGGSTISMQLVKNVFLNRHKNMARKLEEALIVWLIEQQHITSKQRMYEVYLNIVEWGPFIYGAREASRFYFNKEPSQLTTEEAIFLASIIPKPKHFRSSFNPDGSLKTENNEYYFQKIAERLQAKGLLTDEQAAAVRPEIELKGEALKMITVPEVKADSVQMASDIYQGE